MAFFARVQVNGWRGLVEQLELLDGGGWVFRGHGNANWAVQTTLERALNGRPHAAMEEQRALDMFRRRIGHYATRVKERDWLEVSALLRHHGGPSRLLDVTASRWVAAYFALATMDEKAGCAVWAFEPSAFTGRTTADWPSMKALPPPSPEELLDEAIDARELLAPGLLHVQPWAMNERVAAQQGSFLVPMNVEHGFERNLIAVAADNADEERNKHKLSSVIALAHFIKDRQCVANVVKIIVDNTAPDGSAMSANATRRDGLRALREMNITAASLYPGLDGFAQSISVRISSDDK